MRTGEREGEGGKEGEGEEEVRERERVRGGPGEGEARGEGGSRGRGEGRGGKAATDGGRGAGRERGRKRGGETGGETGGGKGGEGGGEGGRGGRERARSERERGERFGTHFNLSGGPSGILTCQAAPVVEKMGQNPADWRRSGGRAAQSRAPDHYCPDHDLPSYLTYNKPLTICEIIRGRGPPPQLGLRTARQNPPLGLRVLGRHRRSTGPASTAFSCLDWALAATMIS